MANHLVLKQYDIPDHGEYLLHVKTSSIITGYSAKIIHIKVVNTRKNTYYYVDGTSTDKKSLDLYLSNLRAEIVEIVK